MSLTLDVVELDPKDETLLRKFHEALSETFGEDELDDLETMIAELDGTHPRVSMVCVVAMDRDDPTRTVLGGAVWEYFIESQCEY